MLRTHADTIALEQGCYFDQVLAERPIQFAEKFFHSQFITGQFRLLPWQATFIRYLYGWRLPSGHRRFRLCNLHVPKKAGKTLLCSVIAMYELLAAGEASPFVISAAPSRENAAQIFDEVAYSLTHSPFAQYVHTTPHIKRLKINDLNAEFRSLASDGKRVHGYNASVCIVDEAARVPEPLWSALRYAGDARANFTSIVISTCGDETDHWYYGLYSKAKRILSGEDTDITHAAFVYESDTSKPEEDEDEWVRANPSIGTSFGIEQFRRDFKAAKSEGIGPYLNFLRLKLNRWVSPSEASWLQVDDYASHHQELQDGYLRECRASVGVDLSEAGDPSSVSIMWDLGNGEYHVKSWAWVCEAGVKDRARQSNQPRYDQWTREGSLEVSPGSMIDARQVRDFILNLCQVYNVQSINFDPRGAYSMMLEIQEEGYECARIPQSFRYFSPLLKEFGRAWTENRISHDGKAWLKFCLGNVRVETNRYDEARPYRKRSVDHIDGAVAALLAFHGLLTGPKDDGVPFVW